MTRCLFFLLVSCTALAVDRPPTCFDVTMHSGAYDTDPICAQSDDFAPNTLPRCAPLTTFVVDGCLGFNSESETLRETIVRDGRDLVRRLTARDRCGTHWEMRYRIHDGALSVTAALHSRCGDVPLRQSAGHRILSTTSDDSRTIIERLKRSDAEAEAAAARLFLDPLPAGPTCDALGAAVAKRRRLAKVVLRNAHAKCLAPAIEAKLVDVKMQAAAEQALLRLPIDKAALLLRAIDRGIWLPKITAAVSADERARLKSELLKPREQARGFAATSALLALYPDAGAAIVVDELHRRSCTAASQTLRDFPSVSRALAKATAVLRQFTPLLRPDTACEELRILAAAALVKRLAGGSAATPAAWHLLLSTIEEDPSPRVRRQALQTSKAHFHCGARSDDLMMPAFFYDALNTSGIQLICHSAEVEPDTAPPADIDDIDGVDPPPMPEGNAAKSAPPKADKLTRPASSEHLGAYVSLRAFPDGALAGFGIHGMWTIDDNLWMTTSASLGYVCSGCLLDSAVQRVDIRIGLGMVYFPFPNEMLSPYGRASFLFGGAEVSRNRTAVGSVLMGGSAGLGVDWLLAKNYSVFVESNAFLLGEVDPGAGIIPTAAIVPTLGREQLGVEVRLGFALNL